jgi:predicted nucleic acid-binding protein
LIYFDSSYIVKCYLNEPGSAEVQRLAEGQTGLTSCLHGRLEVWSAIRRHVKHHALTAAQARRVLTTFARDEREGIWTFAPLTAELVQTACKIVQALPREVFVRSADALHLVCARELGLRAIYTHDRHQLSAASHFGLRGLDVIAAA